VTLRRNYDPTNLGYLTIALQMAPIMAMTTAPPPTRSSAVEVPTRYRHRETGVPFESIKANFWKTDGR
jgi:hypothetical protein